MNNIENQSTLLRSIFIYSSMAVLFVAIGILIGTQFLNVESYKQGEEAVRSTTTYDPATSARGIYKAGGVVESINGNKVLFKSETGQNAVLSINVTSSTVIEKLVRKSQLELKEETDTYLKNIEGKQFDTTPPVLPVPFIKKTIQLKEIMIGDYISVVSKEDISGLKEFTAASIEVHLLPVTE